MHSGATLSLCPPHPTRSVPAAAHGQSGAQPCACFVPSVLSPPRSFSPRPGKGTARETWQASLRPRAARGGLSQQQRPRAVRRTPGAAPSPLGRPQGRGHTPPPLRRAVPVNSGRKGTGGRSAVTHSPGIRSPSPAPARFNVPPAVSRSAAPAPTPRPRRDRDPSVCPGTQGEGAAAGRRRTPTSWCAGSGPARSRAGPPSRLPAAVPSEAACAAAVPPNGAPRRHLRSRGTRRRARTPRASERPAAERRPKPLPPRRTQLRAAPAPPQQLPSLPAAPRAPRPG